MTMGEKIKRARQAKGMTQRQVAGERITRNMLSKIENGSATPSLKTLEYIAARLGLPSSYFLGDGGPDALHEKRGVAGAREAYRRGDCLRALELLEQSENAEAERADEIAALRALACAGIARAEYRAGDLARARAYARESIKHNDAGLYYMGDVAVECRQIIMLCAVRSRNPSIIADGREAAEGIWAEEQRGGLTERTELIERFWFAERLERLERQPKDDQPGDAWARAMRHYLKGREKLAEGRPAEASEELRLAAEAAEWDGGRMLQDDIYSALEQTARDQGDFRAAYEFAAKRLSLQGEQ